MNALRKWLADRRERRNRNRYAAGFGHAMARYHLDSLHPDSLRATVVAARAMGTYTTFHAGILQALIVIDRGRHV